MTKEVLAEKQAEDFLKKYLPIAKSVLAKDINQALKFIKSYPIVLKLISKQALHKTEVKGIRIVNNEQEFKKHYNQLIKLGKKYTYEGILVQEHLQGQEIIIGIKKDTTFNHVLMFGIGGVLVEVLKDVQFRACPITEKDAQDMIKQLKLKTLLTGFRNTKPVNLKLLKSLLIKTSKIPKKYPNIIELDINPLIINSKEAKVVDARIVLG